MTRSCARPAPATGASRRRVPSGPTGPSDPAKQDQWYGYQRKRRRKGSKLLTTHTREFRKGDVVPTPAGWLLVDLLEPWSPSVVAIGTRPKSRVPLRSFIRPSDLDGVLDAVQKAFTQQQPTENSWGSRIVKVDPIIDDVTGLVHGVWLQVASRSIEALDRPAAWTFEWNLDTGVARRGAILSSVQSWTTLQIEQTRRIPDGLAKLDLGAATGSILARLVADKPGSVVQEIGVEQRPVGGNRLVQFTARFVGNKQGKRTGGMARLVRGVSVDLGPSEGQSHAPRRADELGDRIARSLADTHEYRAIVDPRSLRLLYWYDEAPAEIAWQSGHSLSPAPVLHPDDLPAARRAAGEVEGSRAGTKRRLQVRLLTIRGSYAPVPITVRTVDLDGQSRALLVTLELAK